MGFNYSFKIVTNGLALYLDAANSRSYPGSSTIWNDLSRTANNSSLINGPTFNSANFGTIVFDGVDDYVGTSTMQGTASFTICVWVKVNYNSSTYYGRIAEKGFNSEWTLTLNKGAPKFNVQYFDYQNIVQSITNVDSTKYQFVSATVSNNGTTATGLIYVNGVLDNTGSRNVTPTNLTGPIYLGGNPAATQTTMAGNIGSFAYYTRVLSAIEIQQNFNATKGRYGL